MAVVYVPNDGQRLRAICLQADVATLTIPNSEPGDWVKVLDGNDVVWDGNSWEDEASESLGSVDSTITGPLGRRADAQAVSVALSTENAALVGPLTETAPATDNASSGLNGRLQRIAQRLTSLIALVPAALGQQARAASFAVTLSTEDVALLDGLEGSVDGLEAAIAALVQESSQVAASASVAAVADSATNVTILAANAARKGACIFNTSSAILAIKFGATAVFANSFTARIAPNQLYELPKGRGIYTGIIDGIWETDPGTGSAIVTEW